MNRRPPENDPESPSSVDEPSPKKSKRGVQKRVVSVPIGGGADVDGSKSRGGESYPPSDSWAWRKYGQKPIKGSPYPRGYYRCSSSKGCPARKQVERSRVDPTTLIVTYACDHNHPIPAKPQQHHAPVKPAGPALADPEPIPPEESDVSSTAAAEFSNLDPGAWVFDRAICEWFGGDDVASTAVVLESPDVYDDAVDATAEVSGEDESLFGDLGELPECSVVFRRRIAVPFGGGEGIDRWTATG